jgi:hypothetical protein
MADRDDAREIQGVWEGERCQIIGGPRDILKGARPASSSVAQPSILDIPGGNPVLYKILGQPLHERQVIGSAPEASVYEKNDRVWTRTVRQVQFAKLQWFRSIGEP